MIYCEMGANQASVELDFCTEKKQRVQLIHGGNKEWSWIFNGAVTALDSVTFHAVSAEEMLKLMDVKDRFVLFGNLLTFRGDTLPKKVADTETRVVIGARNNIRYWFTCGARWYGVDPRCVRKIQIAADRGVTKFERTVYQIRDLEFESD